MLSDRIAAIHAAKNAGKPAGPPAPKGWEAGIHMSGDSGELSTGALTKPVESPNEWAELLAIWDLDPEKFEVVGDPEFRAWDANLGEGSLQRFYYYKAKVRLRVDALMADDWSELADTISKWRLPKPSGTEGAPPTLVLVSDTQFGKGDHGGFPTILRVVSESMTALEAELQRMKRRKQLSDVGYLCFLGDLIESCKGSYASQQSTSDLPISKQVLVVKRFAVEMTKLMLRFFPQVVMVAVPGNHGYASRNSAGKPDSIPSDNWDTIAPFMAFEQMCERKDVAERLRFHLPEGEEIAVTLDIGGELVTFVHGHITSGGSGPEGKMMNWWKNMSHTGQLHGASKLLFSGHYHHPRMVMSGSKTWFQLGALDCGSQWYENATGQDTPPGMTLIQVSKDLEPRGWDHYKLL